MDLGPRVRERRRALGLSQENLAHQAGVSLNAVHKLEAGRIVDPHFSTLSGIAGALGTTVAELVGEEEPVLAGPKAKAPREAGPPHTSQEELEGTVVEDERPTREPLSPELRKRAAEMRRDELESVLKHLTLRTETLRDQAKQRDEATDKQGLWALFLDSVLLVEGAESWLSRNMEEAEELGFETKEERQLRARLEHRTEDLDELTDKIGDMWTEAAHAEADAEHEAERDPGHHDVPNIPNILRKRQAS